MRTDSVDGKTCAGNEGRAIQAADSRASNLFLPAPLRINGAQFHVKGKDKKKLVIIYFAAVSESLVWKSKGSVARFRHQ